MENANRFDLSVIIHTAKSVILKPVDFYQSMATAGGYANPVIFVLVMGVISALEISIWALLGGGPAAGFVSGLLTVVIMPLLAMIGSFIGALVLFVIWKLMGSTRNYETAYRCTAFASAIMPVVALANVLPYLGQILNIVWGLALIIIASEQVHGISRNKALLVFAMLGALYLYSTIMAEYQARKLRHMAQGFEQQLRQLPSPRQSGQAPAVAGGEQMTPSQLGKAATEFITGLQQGSGEMLTDEERAELVRAGEAVGKFMQSMQQSAQELQQQDIDEMGPKEAGAAVGTLLKNLQIAANDMQAQMAPDLATVDIAELEPLGSIEASNPEIGLQLAVNDDEVLAPLSRPVNVYRDSGGIRYQLWLDSARLPAFIALGAAVTTDAVAAAGVAKTAVTRTVALGNAVVYTYDQDGKILGGDQCQRSVLQIPAATDGSLVDSERQLWLWCPQSERMPINP